jgi:outer membrane receptor protein involved in Fe transport
MKHISKLNAGVATAVLGLAMISTPSFAADAAPAAADATAPAPADATSTIIVTGTLVKNPNLVQSNPVNVVTADELQFKQSNTAEEALREIPGLVADIGSAVNNGNNGQSNVNLRGLGSNRNVVLLDGQRIVPGSLNGVVDLNNIPLALISRVDVLTGAAVTTYGADAITGVVNFVTKKNFSGVDLSLGDTINQAGDGNYFRGDLTIGSNFADGKGNAVLSIGYQKSDPVYQGDRDYGKYDLSSYSGTAAGSGTTVPGRFNIAGSSKPGTKYSINPTTGALQSGYTAYNFNPFNLYQTPFKRYNMFAKANYEVTDSIEVYARAMFSQNTVEAILAPSGAFGTTINMNYNNPYLPTAMRLQECSGSLSGTFSAASPLTLAQCNAAATATGPGDPNYKTFSLLTQRRMPELGNRDYSYQTTMYDLMAGIGGALTSSISWDVHAAYGHSQNVSTTSGYLLTDRLQAAALASSTTACDGGQSGCVPVNLFGGLGSINQAMANYLTQPTSTTVTTSLSQIHGQVSGDFGWKLPTASEPVSFALGTEYRSYGATQLADILAQTPGELGGAGGAAPTINGSYKVIEGFTEVIAPLVSDKPGMYNITAELGARYSKYEVPGGSGSQTWTYKGGLTWAFDRQIKVRANYAHAVRAPNIGELFSPDSDGLTNLKIDPCAGAAPVGNANLTAVCLAQGAPQNAIGNIANPSAAQINILTGGNLNLKPETANTVTAGVVLQPDLIPHLSMSVDYYNIKISNIIGVPTPGQLISACFGNLTATSATSTACTVIRRDPTTGGLDGNQVTGPGLFGLTTNLPEGAKTDGVDLTVNYSHRFSGLNWTANFVGNWTREQTFNGEQCAGYFSANCGSIQPHVQFSLRNTFTMGPVDVSVLWRYIAPENQEPADVAANGAAFVGNLPSGIGTISGQYVNFGHIPAYNYFDLTTRFTVQKNFTLTVAVLNLLNKAPPLVGGTIGSTAYNSGNTYPSTYDALGRRVAVNAKISF